MTDPADYSIPEAALALREGRLTARQLVTAALDRIAQRNDRLHAFTHLNPDALAEADRADAMLAAGAAPPLCGIPVAAKDLIDVGGLPATLQARLLRMEAVGQRLASAAKLDGGEFDFDQEPAFGGPYTSENLGDSAPTEFSLALDRLASQIENRETQLQVMERLLVNRELALDVAVDGWPVASGYVSSVFGRRTDPFSGRQAFHKGLDFTARPGTPVMAVASGVVTWAGWDKDYGKLIEIRHSDGYRSRYAHNSEIVVKPGQVVKKGQKIAKVGATGRASGTHLHLEVLANGQLVDPRQYIGTRRAVR